MSELDTFPGGAPRIGCVPYLNARPLLEGLSCPVTELVPAQLFDSYQAGTLDAALLSSIDVLAMPHPEVVDGVSISSRGDVYSVILVYTGELQALQTVHLDPASHTSNALLQIILGEFHALNPEYVRLTEDQYQISKSLSAQLLIGDRAITFRNQPHVPDVKILDLGGEWFRHTGLPFVFALWSLKNDFTGKNLLADRLRQAKQLGLSSREEIAARTPDPVFALRYLSEWIRYDLGEEEKQGLNLFREYLESRQLIPGSRCKMSYL